MTLENHFNFIEETEGKEGVEKVEKELEKLGCPLKYEEIKNFHWYSEKLDDAILFVAKRIFNWDDDKIRESGKWGAKISYITRIMMKYFVSIERVFREVNNYWRKYHTCGNLIPVQIKEKERNLILELKDFNNVAPEHYRYLEGYFWQIGSCLLPKENLRIKIKETDCFFEGKDIHRFKVEW